MVSGKYSALAGAISREQAIANVAANLANVNTVGYKRSQVSFAAILRGEEQRTITKGINYTRVDKNFTDFSGGALRQTDNPLDLAIQGEAFFKVQAADGVRYTRRGDFAIGAEGQLTTGNGLPVLDAGNAPITIPDTDTSRMAVSDDGTISILGPQGARAEVAQLAVVEITDKTKLRREGDTTFSLEDDALEVPAEETRIIQGSLELANVDMAAELTRMIDGYRTFETYHKVLKSYSTIGEQQEELGTLG
jgi:flagellar basal-body rod protein FlgF